MRIVIPIVLALCSTACETSKGSDSGGSQADPEWCPLDTPLEASDLPCTCGGGLVESCPQATPDCACDSTADFTCW